MKLMQTKINYNDSKILYNRKVSEEMLAQDFDIKTGSWSVRDGWIIGKNPLNNPGMIVSKADYFGNIMLEFTAATILRARMILTQCGTAAGMMKQTPADLHMLPVFRGGGTEKSVLKNRPNIN